MRSRIGEVLVAAGLIKEVDLRRAVAEQARSGERLGEILVRLNIATEEEIARSLASQLGFPYVDLAEDPPNPVAARLVDRALAVRSTCVAIRLESNVLTVAMADPLVFSLVPDLERQTGYRIREVIATRSAILNAIESAYAADLERHGFSRDSDLQREDSSRADSDLEREGFSRAADQSVHDLLQAIIDRAVESDATDIHVDPLGDRVTVRYRVDGALVDGMDLPGRLHAELVARIKLMAGLDVAEKLLPQSGRVRFGGTAAGVHLRVTTIRTADGERVVMRALARRRRTPDLEHLGLSPSALGQIRDWLRSDRGMVVVIGPRASGKTTSLYAIALSLKRDHGAILSIEDPIELRLSDIAQTEVDQPLGLTFAAALRSALDQDVDVVMIGDLRDGETATLAVRAAQTERLVMAALDGGDAASGAIAIAELAGAPLAASALVGIVAQRLVRRLCESCRAEYSPSAEALRSLGLTDGEPEKFFKPIGCDQCNHTGFRGRVGLFETMSCTARIRELIAARASDAAVRAAAVAEGMVTLADDGVAKARSGMTTIEEVRRVVGSIGGARPLCVTCGAAVGPDFTVCPRCGAPLGPTCAHCGRALQAGWTYCPYCSQSVEAKTHPPKRGIIRLVKNQEPPDTV